jgi:glucosyl-3-phosphoglycerate synthase
MAREVTRAMMSHLWTDLGFSAEPRKLERLADAYLATAQVLLTRYKHEAAFNGLESVTAEEQKTVRAFAGIIRHVAGESLATRPAAATLPSWESVLERLPVVAASLRITSRSQG